MPVRHNLKTWWEWINWIEEEGVDLTTWEKDFVASIREQLDSRKRISEKQEEILERIYAEKTP